MTTIQNPKPITAPSMKARSSKRLAGKSRRDPLISLTGTARRHARGVRAKRRRACGGRLQHRQPRVLLPPVPCRRPVGTGGMMRREKHPAPLLTKEEARFRLRPPQPAG